jgi:hypothetical protein
MTVTASSLALSTNQFRNLNGIVAAVKKRGWPKKAAIIAVETVLTESGMRMIASANVPASVRYPHDLLSWTWDGLGHDHASCGMYQQQVGPSYSLPGTSTVGDTTWGTPAQLMNPEYSTTIFLNRLAQHPWQSMTNWAAAQAVQGSAFPDGSNYRASDSRATNYVNAVWGLGGTIGAGVPAATSVLEDKVLMLIKYTGPDVKNHNAVFLTDMMTQRWVRTATDLKNIVDTLHGHKLDTAVHVTARLRSSYGLVIGPDPK